MATPFSVALTDEGRTLGCDSRIIVRDTSGHSGL